MTNTAAATFATEDREDFETLAQRRGVHGATRRWVVITGNRDQAEALAADYRKDNR